MRAVRKSMTRYWNGATPGSSERVAAPEAQHLALQRFVLARQAGQDLAAEGVDVRSDIVGEDRPELIVDDVDTDEATRHPARRRTRFGFRRHCALEQSFDDLEPLFVDRRHGAARAHRLAHGLGGQAE